MKEKLKDIKLLLIANRKISETDANGRTLLNLLGRFNKEQLYQIYTAGGDNGAPVCNGYFGISNKDAVKGIIGIKPKKTVEAESVQEQTAAPIQKPKKTALTMYLRDVVWSFSFGVAGALKKWVDEIKPNAIILQLGDSAHIVKIALKLSKHANIPVLVFNTEDYYFKNYNYMKRTGKSDILFNIFQNNFKRSLKKLFAKHPNLVTNCEGLKEIFDKEFNLNSEVIYTASALNEGADAAARNNEDFYISYCGNLGIDRHLSLIEIANELKNINPDIKLHIYGNAPSEKIKDELVKCEAVEYHGVVSYSEVLSVIRKSRLAVHAEGFDPYIAMDTRYAFSTKIADCVSSRVPFLIYAPSTCEGLRYVKENDAGFTASTQEELKAILPEALLSNEKREKIVQNAAALAEKNHSLIENGSRMANTVEKILLNRG